MIMNRWLVRLMLINVMLLSGCAHHPVAKPPAQCSAMSLQITQSQVEAINGQLVELGDQVLIDLPTQAIFIGNSKNLTPVGSIILENVTKQLQCYKTQSISVKVYTGTLACGVPNKALAAQRAQLTADVLRTYGLNGLIYNQGVNIVNAGTNCWLNRIEIVTKQLS